MSDRPPAPIAGQPRPGHADEYAAFRGSVQASLQAAAVGPLYSTDAHGLFELFLGALSADRQRHDCAACRRFVEDYGGVIAVKGDGVPVCALWAPDRVPPFYRAGVQAMAQAVGRARITGVHLSAATTWGKPESHGWAHLACEPPAAGVFRPTLRTAQQAMAAKREDFQTVSRALTSYRPDVLKEALRLLRAEALSRSERFVGPVEWLSGLHQRCAAARGGERRANLVWLAVATAPEGYCHPRASVVGTLLEDLAARRPFDEVKARFDAKLHPLRYQRPQAAPSSGTIAQAEALVAALGLAPSLLRRFARLDEVTTMWRSAVIAGSANKPAAAASPAPPGVFGFLRAKEAGREAASVAMPPMTITWTKFAHSVLPTAAAIEVLIPERGNFMALTTAVHADAPPLLKWDRAEARNPVAFYVYPQGSPDSQWGLKGGTWSVAMAVVPSPTLWGATPMPFLGEGVLLVLDGAADSGHPGSALFPEHLRTELHGVRAAMEAFSNSTDLVGYGDASACGLCVWRGGRIDATVRVLAGGGRAGEGWTTYLVDRWD